MKLFSWNVNGIRAVQKKNVLMPFIDEYQPDILCLQETKAQPDQIEIDLPQYHLYWHSAERKGYSSTGIISKIKPIRTENGLPDQIKSRYPLEDTFGDTTNEGRVIMAEFEDFIVLNVYTPNVKDNLSRVPVREQWDKAFMRYALELEKNKPVIICGDLNVAHMEDDLARSKENVGKKGFTEEERTGIDKLIKSGFHDSFRMFTQGNGYYTWWSHWGKSRERNVGWRIDYFLVSDQLKSKVKAADIYPDVIGSDHCPISLELEDE